MFCHIWDFGIGDCSSELVVPVRKVFPDNYSSSEPLPCLHVFLGKAASRYLRFTKSANEALKLYPITEEMPDFLRRPDVAPHFVDVWIATKISEAAKYGCKLWNYETDIGASIRYVESL